MATKKKVKLTRNMAQMADLYYRLREERAVLNKEVNSIDADIKAVREHLINGLEKGEASGISGKLARVWVDVSQEPVVENWNDFYKYVSRNKRFDFLQRRLNPLAIKLVWDDGKKIPGVKSFGVVKLHVGKSN